MHPKQVHKFETSDSQLFDTLQEAEEHEAYLDFMNAWCHSPDGYSHADPGEVLDWVWKTYKLEPKDTR